ncbi:MAG: cob(I)yrinic acid a,c-diamide adenosyltransferase [Candidatus Adiutrix sp.]
MTQGLILVNTGHGKGKTTAAIGTLVRALGQGLRAAFLQFIKNQPTGESIFLENFAKNNPNRLYYNRLGLGCMGAHPSSEDIEKAHEALKEAEKLLSDDYDLVVLDEICIAVSRGLISLDSVLKLIEIKTPKTNLILTGRNCPPEIMAIAHTVTEMKPIKHAYSQGIDAKRGLEF